MPEEYIDLHDVISIEGLSYNIAFFRYEEVHILQPRLEALGYTDIEWSSGETDSFGPLTRIVKALNPEGETVWFIYG